MKPQELKELHDKLKILQGMAFSDPELWEYRLTEAENGSARVEIFEVTEYWARFMEIRMIAGSRFSVEFAESTFSDVYEVLGIMLTEDERKVAIKLLKTCWVYGGFLP